MFDKICIDVNRLSDLTTGIGRYMYETIARIDEKSHASGIDVECICSSSLSPRLPHLRNISTHVIDGKRGSMTYRINRHSYLRSQNAVYCNMAFGLPNGPSVILIHDVRPID